jgi:hypothetical protein
MTVARIPRRRRDEASPSATPAATAVVRPWDAERCQHEENGGCQERHVEARDGEDVVTPARGRPRRPRAGARVFAEDQAVEQQRCPAGGRRWSPRPSARRAPARAASSGVSCTRTQRPGTDEECPSLRRKAG